MHPDDNTDDGRCEEMRRLREANASLVLALTRMHADRDEWRAQHDNAVASWYEERDRMSATKVKLQRQIRIMQESLERKNRELDALHYVWCSGGCATGVHRWTDAEVTEELVLEAERNTKRLRQWWEAHRTKSGRGGNVAAEQSKINDPSEKLFDHWIDVVFDGPPSHQSGRFVEVEDEHRSSISSPDVKWVQRSDGYWVLRIRCGGAQR